MIYTPPGPNPNDAPPPAAKLSASVPVDPSAVSLVVSGGEDQANLAVGQADGFSWYVFGAQVIADAYLDEHGWAWQDPDTGAVEGGEGNNDPYRNLLSCVAVRDFSGPSAIVLAGAVAADPRDWSGQPRSYAPQAASAEDLTTHWAQIAPMLVGVENQQAVGIVLAGGLVLGQSANQRWWHRTYPVIRNARTELWHTKLLALDGEPLVMRAVGGLFLTGPPYLSGLTIYTEQRNTLVLQTAAFKYGDWDVTTSPTPFLPHEILVESALMSQLGATIAWRADLSRDDDGTGSYSPGGGGFDHRYDTVQAYVEKYTTLQYGKLLSVHQRLNLGREVTTATETVQLLVPFGHRVLQGQSYNRGLTLSGNVAVVEMDNTFAIIDRSIRLPYDPQTGAQQPFVQVDIVAPELPNLSENDGVWQTDGGVAYQLPLRAVDAMGNVVHFTVPFRLVSEPGSGNAFATALGGQRLAFQTTTDDSATFPTKAITISPGVDPQDHPHPTVSSAIIVHPALHPLGVDTPLTITPTSGEIYATFAGVTIGGPPSSSSVGAPPTRELAAVGQVSLPVNALHAAQGLVPVSGGAPLLPPGALMLFARFDLSKADPTPPQITSRVDASGARTTAFNLRPAREIVASAGCTAATFDGLSLVLELVSGSSQTSRTLSASCARVALTLLTSPANAANPTEISRQTGIAVTLKQLAYTRQDGAKPRLAATLDGLRFQGDLEFVQVLLDIIPFDLFSNPPALSVTDAGAVLDYELELPDLAFGVFELAGLALDASLKLPFTGDKPSFTLALPGEGRQFAVAVCGLGGTGSFELTIATDDVHVHAELGFGGMLSIDLIVISGSVQATGGLTLDHDSHGSGSLSVGGYAEIQGWVNALDIASVGIGVELELDYRRPPGDFYGAGDLWVHVSVLFVSINKSVAYSMDLTGGGSADDTAARRSRGVAASPPPLPPTPQKFTDVVSVEQWRQYCQAFVAVGG